MKGFSLAVEEEEEAAALFLRFGARARLGANGSGGSRVEYRSESMVEVA